MILIMRGDNTSLRLSQDVRKLLAEEAKPLTYRNAAHGLSYWRSVLDAAIAPERVEPARDFQF